MDEIISFGDKAITRPPRSKYSLNEIPLEINIPECDKILRHPFKFPNNRGLRIIGSFYGPSDMSTCDACVIYLHGNASCQLEGTFLVPIMVPLGIGVCCIDMSGCGKSEGERISLGYLEKDDVACTITYLEVHYGIKKFSLWGRSMGAACSFFCLTNEQKIKGAVVDSPFASLPVLVKDLAAQMGIPECFGGITLKLLANKIIESSGFDIREVIPVDEARKCKEPIFIIHGESDDFIYVKHAKELYDQYGGEDKTLEIVPGQNHNSERPPDLVARAMTFTTRILGKETHIDNINLRHNAGHHHFGDVEEMMEEDDMK